MAAGLVLLGHVFYPRADAGVKQRLWATVRTRLAELEDTRARRTFDDRDSVDMYFESRADLGAAIDDFRSRHIERTGILVYLISLAGMVTGAVYMSAGAALWKDSPRFGALMTAGFCLWGVYLLVFMWNACEEIRFMDYTSVELWQMAALLKPVKGSLKYAPLVKSLFSFSVTRTALAACAWTVFFLLLPLYFYMRPIRKNP